MEHLIKYYMQHYGDTAEEARARALHFVSHPDAKPARDALLDATQAAEAQTSGGAPGFGSVPRGLGLSMSPNARAAQQASEQADYYNANPGPSLQAKRDDLRANRTTRNHQSLRGVHGVDPAQYQAAQREQQMLALHAGLVQKGLDPQLAAMVTTKLMPPTLVAPQGRDVIDRMDERNASGPTTPAEIAQANLNARRDQLASYPPAPSLAEAAQAGLPVTPDADLAQARLNARRAVLAGGPY